jgi:threonine/homoserine/homoserine lactone efflux protein
MLGIQNLPLFITAGLLLNMTPGPDTLYILGRSLAQGKKAGIASVLGISTGSLLHTLAAAFGLSAILGESPRAFKFIQYAGAAYLAYLGVGLLRVKPRDGTGMTTALFSAESSWAIYRQAIYTNVLNPKVALFFLAFLPQFILPTSQQRMPAFLLLGSIFVFNGTLWCLFLVYAASFLSRSLRENERASAILRRVTGTLFVGLAIKLTLATRNQ